MSHGPRETGDDTGPGEAVEAIEVVPGEYEVRLPGHQLRVLVPAGVGVPGVPEDELARACVEVLLEQGRALPEVVDVSAELARDPGLLSRLAARVDDEDA